MYDSCLLDVIPTFWKPRATKSRRTFFIRTTRALFYWKTTVRRARASGPEQLTLVISSSQTRWRRAMSWLIICQRKRWSLIILRSRYKENFLRSSGSGSWDTTDVLSRSDTTGVCWRPISSEISSFPTLPVHYPRAQNDHLINRIQTLWAEQQQGSLYWR